MKRIAAVIAGVSLAGLGVRAEETKAETKVEAKHDTDGTMKHKKVAKHKHKGRHGSTTDTQKKEHEVSKNISGGTTETKEMKSDHDAPGMQGDAKMESKETIKRDEHGNVTKHEKTDDKK